jgi:hypothetical protein
MCAKKMFWLSSKQIVCVCVLLIMYVLPRMDSNLYESEFRNIHRKKTIFDL